jgi:uncharacterized protein (TIGR04222 family)
MVNTLYEVRAIEAFELDDPDHAECFSFRLARENGWTRDYAARVVREYKRFVALAVTISDPMTPSNQVDQAWHLHLQDTVGYRQFCADVLGRRLEHRPSRGGPEERAKFTAAYEATLRAYPGIFGDSPPADIWPEAEKRFGVEGHQRWVSTHENWIVPHPRTWVRSLGRSTRLLLAALSLVALAFALDRLLFREAKLSQVLLLLAGGWLLSLLVPAIARAGRAPAVKLAAALTPVEAAYLSGGPRRALDCFLTQLVSQGTLSFDSDTKSLRIAGGFAASSDLELRLRAALVRNHEMSVGDILARARDWTRHMREELTKRGLLGRRRAIEAFISLLFPAVALAHAVCEAATQSLAPLLLFALVASVITATNEWSVQGRTSYGNQVVQALRRLRPAPAAADPREDAPSSEATAFGIASFGLGTLTGTELSGWGDALASVEHGESDPSDPSDAGACGAEGGGDGGGCGGGCGGCGGGCGCG